MKKNSILNLIVAAATAMTLLPAIAAPATKGEATKLAQYQEAERIGKERLVNFDTLDFDVYSNQKWDRLKESHAADILVTYPDGHTTTGIPDHVAELKKLFTFAPDTRIRSHPVRIASAEWTSVIGEMEGTFSLPMAIGEGKFIQPTGKKFKLHMSTVGHWTGGTMDAEYLFWDNLAFMQQIGLAQ
jgi:hypothetical protein